MRILYLTHYFWPEGNAPASRALEMGRCWARAGHDVQVITCAPNVPAGKVYPGYRNRLFQRETIEGMDVLRVWSYVAPNKGTLRRIMNYLSYMVSATAAGTMVARPDVILATSPQFFCGWAGVLLHRLRQVPMILEIRDIWPESIEATGAMRSSPALRALEHLERRMYASADRIVTVGAGYRRKLLERNVEVGKIDIVHNGVDFDLFSPAKPDETIRRKWNLGNAFVCAYVGTLGISSGLDVVLRAARTLKQNRRDDVKFLLAGDGACREKYQARARKEGLDNVVFTGRLNKTEIPSLLASTDACLVHLRKQELFKTVLPSKMFEAAAMAKPILLGVQGCAAEMISSAGAGLCFVPEDDRGLMEAIDTLQADPQEARAMGKRGRRWVEASFDRRDLAQRYMEILQAVAARSRGFRMDTVVPVEKVRKALRASAARAARESQALKRSA
jgi:hypothetical protein